MSVSKNDLDIFADLVDGMYCNNSISTTQHGEYIQQAELIAYLLNFGLAVAPENDVNNDFNYTFKQLSQLIIDKTELVVKLSKIALVMRLSFGDEMVGAASFDALVADMGANLSSYNDNIVSDPENDCLYRFFVLDDEYLHKSILKQNADYKDISFLKYGDYLPLHCFEVGCFNVDNDSAAVISDFMRSLSISKHELEKTKHKQTLEDELKTISELSALILSAESWHDLRVDVIPKIQDTYISEPLNRSNLSVMLQQVHKQLNGTTLSKKDADQLVKFRANDSLKSRDNPLNHWCNDIVYIRGMGHAIKSTRLIIEDKSEFNLEYTCKVPPIDAFKNMTAFQYMEKNGLTRFVDGCIYYPCSNDEIVVIENKTYLNTYNPKTRIKPNTSYSSDAAKEYIELLKKHIFYICNQNEEHTDFLINWIAWQFQHTGKKKEFAPIIQGVQGVGKSFIIDVIRHGIGFDHVGIVTSEQIAETYTDFATGKAVNVIEEMKITGRNRFDNSNKMKMYISNPTVPVRPFGKKSYETVNTCNYCGTSNYKAMTVMDSDDRRYWVLYCEIENIEQLEKITGMSSTVYFSKLFSGLALYRADIAHYFTNVVQISDSFKKCSRAPNTKYKDAVINTSNTFIEGYSEVDQLLKQGGQYWNTNVVCISPFVKALKSMDSYALEYVMTAAKVSKILESMGFHVVSPAAKIDRKTFTVWGRNGVNNNEKARISLGYGVEKKLKS